MWPFSSWAAKQRVESTIASKRTQRSRAIQEGLRAAGVAPKGDNDDQYLRADVSRIAAKVRSREWKARRVLEAYIRSAAAAHTRTNCLTEPLFERALIEADVLDRELASDPDNTFEDKLLLGVPVSLKDQIDVRGVDSSIGFVRYCEQPAAEDATIVRLIREHGAIPFCKTNVPQTMLAFECSNPVFGATLHPQSALHVPGGSSGGEAALLALNGSPLGFGSDVGGSLRIPAHYSGCYAIKPVFGRFPGGGVRGTIPGYEAIRSTLGPMARSVADLELCFRAVAQAALKARVYATEANIVPLPWREVTLPAKLRFGYFLEDGFIPTSPACARAVNETVETLRAAGHDCILVDIPSRTRQARLLRQKADGPCLAVGALEIFQALASSDGYETLTSHLVATEPREPALFLPTLGPRLPAFVRNFASWILERFAGEIIMGRLVRVSREKQTREVWQWQNRRSEYAEKVRRMLWEQHKLDAVICPVQASPAVTHGASKRLSPLALPTILWNVVDSTVGVLPVTRVDPLKDALPPSFAQKIQQAGTKLLSKLFYSTVYDASAMAGLPVGVQLVAPAYEDERVIEIMKLVDSALETSRGKKFGPNAVTMQDKLY